MHMHSDTDVLLVQFTVVTVSPLVTEGGDGGAGTERVPWHRYRRDLG